VEYFGPNSQEATTDDGIRLPKQNPHNPQWSYDEHYSSESVQSSRPPLESRVVSCESTEHIDPLPSFHAREETSGRNLKTRIKATASRGASLIQRGVGADGVLFLDVTVGVALDGLIESTRGLSQTETETNDFRFSESSSKQAHPHDRQASQDRETAPAQTLAEANSSVNLSSSYPTDIGIRAKSAIEQAKFSKKVLRSLLRRYLDGQVWYSKAEGDAPDKDEETHGGNLSATDGASGSELKMKQSLTPADKRASKRT
jgi:hypothetical protein